MRWKTRWNIVLLNSIGWASWIPGAETRGVVMDGGGEIRKGTILVEIRNQEVNDINDQIEKVIQ